jgi:SAM-dependent methyltransferase
MRPFVDYYRSNDISPVAQPLDARHASRRDSLYRELGLAPVLIRGKHVIEFGPGSGHNAAYTASLGPARYVLVDANPRGLRETAENLAPFAHLDITIVDALIESFATDERFEIVLAENVIPTQHEPAAFLRHVASFAGPGGVVVCTTADAVSVFAESGRRALAQRLAPIGLPLAERVERLRPVFAPHVATLAGMSRTLDDWILDNVTQPFLGSLIGAVEAIRALDGDFEIYGGSPHVLVDWRWYKDLVGDARRFNERAIEAYETQALNLLDTRETFAAHDAAFGRELQAAALMLFQELQRREADGTAGDPAAYRDAIETVRALVAARAPHTAAAIAELLRQLDGETNGPDDAQNLAAFWGRGTQYLSFLRNEPAVRVGATSAALR